MAGKRQNLAPMWKKLMKNVDVEEATSFLDHVDLGCTQRECKPNEKTIEQVPQDVWVPFFCWSNRKITRMGKNRAKNLQHGPATWQDMPENAWTDFVNWRTKRQNNFSRFPVHV